MHRVVTEIRDHHGKRIIEVGPWLLSRDEAENWAEIFVGMGYKAHTEQMNGNRFGGSPTGMS